MAFSPVRPPRLAETVAAQIRDLIFEGALASGTRLPSERELAEQFDTSRPTIRVALASLEKEGLLKIQRGGLHVADPVEDVITAPLNSLYLGHPERFDDFLEFRLIIEREATYFAALRATEVDRDNIRRRFERVVELHDHHPAGLEPGLEAEADAAFHLAIYEACHNMTILHVMRGLASLLRNDVMHNRDRLYPRNGYRDVTVAQHQAIFDAIMAGSPEAARAAANAHIAFVREALTEIAKANNRLEVSLRRIASQGAPLFEITGDDGSGAPD